MLLASRVQSFIFVLLLFHLLFFYFSYFIIWVWFISNIFRVLSVLFLIFSYFFIIFNVRGDIYLKSLWIKFWVSAKIYLLKIWKIYLMSLALGNITLVDSLIILDRTILIFLIHINAFKLQTQICQFFLFFLYLILSIFIEFALLIIQKITKKNYFFFLIIIVFLECNIVNFIWNFWKIWTVVI